MYIIKKITTLLLLVVLISNCTSVIPEKPKTPEELRFELLLQEQQTPLTYLSVKAKMRTDKKMVRAASIFRDAEYEPDGKTIHGTINNSATIAKFKDVILTVTYFSKTKSIIESKDYILYEFYKPGSSSPFELKVYPPDAEDGFDVEIKGATIAN